jgi:hypothetical protein
MEGEAATGVAEAINAVPPAEMGWHLAPLPYGFLDSFQSVFLQFGIT